METALQTPDATPGVFSLEEVRAEFAAVMETLTEFFKELEGFIRSYDKIDTNWYQKGKWAAIGVGKADELGKLLSVLKLNLLLALSLNQR